MRDIPLVPALRRLSVAALAGIGLLLAATSHPQAKPYGPGTGSAAAHMAATAAMTCEARSPDHTVALLELYTSEGCSSCPPADRWLQSLPGKGLDFSRLVPLSLHVGYWDYIGWQDPYAQARFADRQRDYARLRQASNVYTPQLVLAGADLRAWGDAPLAQTVKSLATKPAAARIEIEASAVGSALKVKAAAQLLPASGKPSGSQPEMHLAVFEMGLRNAVSRGENSGTTLTHDFVVRHWLGPKPLAQGKASGSEIISLPQPANGRRLGLAAFVQNERGEVLQATACEMR